MECKECCREISEEDSKLYDGYCKNCYKEKNSTSKDEYINATAAKLLIIKKIILIIGIVSTIACALFFFSEEYTLLGVISLIIGFFITTISSILLEAKAEIINLLEDLKTK